MIMGLLVSAISPNPNIAPLLTIVFLVPQITFGGALLPISSLGVLGQLVNQITITKWSFEPLVTLNNLGRSIADDSCWQLTKDERNKLSSDEKKQRCQCLGEKLFKGCYFPGIKGKYDAILDKAEPVKPKDPGKVPSNPIELDAYQKKVDEYKTAIDSWQKDYSEWKGKYEGTIRGAEATIEHLYEQYGSMFKVNVSQYWGVLCGLMVVMLGLILFLQKRKDIV
jgi:hypothetical protein